VVDPHLGAAWSEPLNDELGIGVGGAEDLRIGWDGFSRGFPTHVGPDEVRRALCLSMLK